MPVPAPQPAPGPLPAPVPTPPSGPAPVPAGPDKPAVDFFDWLLKVKSGYVRLDDHDKEVLKAVSAALADLEKPVKN